MSTLLTFHEHPRLAPAAFRTTFPGPLVECTTPQDVLALLRGDAGAVSPLPAPTDALRGAVRDLLRFGGYKPTGRGKPSSEYLARAVGEGALASINAAVDVCNAVSLCSGFPISVVDLARATPPFSVAVAGAGRYVFNAGGQELDHDGLLVLSDAEGPCANAVKDAQRTKTSASTRETLTVIWAPEGFDALLAATRAWSERLLAAVGAHVTTVA
jgi:DNA/RNA-binding domain of Phe-tRNA-synthetase-like protein